MGQRLIEKAENEHSLCEEELAELLTSSAAEEPLAAAADRVRRKYVGDGVHLRGLIEFTNICRRSCFYCGLRRENERAERYRLRSQEIVRLAQNARGYGYRTVVLQGGEDGYWHVERLAPILREIRALGLVITLSIGERTKEEYRALKEAGASRFLLRIETTDRELYERLDPGMSWEARRACLASLRALGYEVGTGSLVGLPGQSVESLARDILFFQEIDADMVGIGPFIPNGDTPLGEAAAGDIHLTRRMVSLLRLLLPEANIPATLGRKRHHAECDGGRLSPQVRALSGQGVRQGYARALPLILARTAFGHRPFRRRGRGFSVQEKYRFVRCLL